MIESYNRDYGQSSQFINSLEKRLNTQQIVEDIEMFLQGKKIIQYTNSKGDTEINMVPICEGAQGKANPKGIQTILSIIICAFNTQVVQGNFNEGELSRFIYEIHMSLIKNIMYNLVEWEIAEEDYEIIIDTIIHMIWAFMTRTKDNKERESYIETIRHMETTQIQGDKKMMGAGL